MAQHNDLGRWGEEEAAFYLLRSGFHILEHNWRCPYCEIDIIAEYYGLIVFIEVKTRTSTRNELPEEAVDHYRMVRISRAAEFYLHQHRLKKYPYRFDIIAIDLDNSSVNLRHIVDAFDSKIEPPKPSTFLSGSVPPTTGSPS